MFKVKHAVSAAREIFIYLSIVNIICLAAIIIFGGANYLTLSLFLFVVVSLLFNASKIYRDTPFSLLMSFVVTLYFVIPMTFMSILGEDYQYGKGISEIPYGNDFYLQSSPLAIVFLTVCVGFIGLGIIFGKSKTSTSRSNAYRYSAKGTIWIIFLLVMYYTYLSNEMFVQVMLGRVSSQESLMTFIFFDHAFLVLVSIAFFSLILTSKGFRSFGNKLQFLIITTVFLVISVIATSKGYILVIIYLSFIIPISYLKADEQNKVYFPSVALVMMVIPLAVLVFFYSYYVRTYLHSGGGGSTITVISNVLEGVDDGGIVLLIQDILYRISAALDRYILIFTSFVVEDYSLSYAVEYLSYLIKNFLNLVLPGTPYPDSYSPSSNLFVNVIAKNDMNGHATAAELLRSLNTQPYTLPGVFIIIFGLFSPAFLFAVSFLLAKLYVNLQQPYIRLGLLYLFNSCLLSYGIEVSIANAIHFTLSIFLMMLMVDKLGRFKVFKKQEHLRSVIPDSIN